MLSVQELKKRLPQDFIDSLYFSYNSKIVDNILQGMLNKRDTTIRANTTKCDINKLMEYLKIEGIKFDRVLWYKDGLIIKNRDEKDLQKLSLYEKGYFYIQSLSSMIPPLILNPQENENILDLTAAPGSKTTEISMLMNNKGKIIANELDKIRFEKLKYNLKIQGASIVETLNSNGELLGKCNIGKFDRVLLDTPCSGEGRFIGLNSKSSRDWSLKKIKELTKIQKRLLKSASLAVKKNGIIVYSTCTLNFNENEKIVQYGLDNLGLKLLDINLKIPNTINGFYKNSNGMVYNNLDFDFDNRMVKCMRILPSKNMEGFFIALLKKL